MKKALVLLLALAMVLPMAFAVPANAEVEKEPFYALGWSDFDQEKYPYLDGLLTSNMKNFGDRVVHSYGGVSLTDGQYTDEDVLKFAQKIKEDMDKRPEGMKYWTIFGPLKIMALAPEDALFMDHGVDQMATMMEKILKAYKEIGGTMDGMVVDIEYVGLGVYYLIDAQTESQTNNYTKNPKLLKQIVKNPKYATEIRPLLEEYGFIFYEAENEALQAERTELYSLVKAAGSKYEKSRLVWDTVMRIHLNRYVDEWLYTPLQKYFPEASLSDYQSIDSAVWHKMAAVTDDGIVMSGGNSNKSGNTSSYSYYYSRPSASFYENNQKYSGYNDAIFAAEPFSNLLYDINFTRHMYSSTDTKQIAPWITGYTYGGKKDQSIAYTPYYSDLLYHLGMFDPEPFLSYTYTPEYTSENWVLICQIMNDVMEALTEVAGYADREPIEMPQNWNSKFVLSGMYTGGRNLWRITPNVSVVSRDDFLVKGTSDPTFYVNGETVTFPGGKILAEADIENCGSYGYWVETAADVTPVVTTDAKRYENFPALNFDFNSYKEGAFDYNTSTPKNAWGFTWSKSGDIKGASNIVDVNGDKKLSIIGNSKNWIKDLPNNITAGDTFAKDQAWQITITIPEGLSKDAQINILTYEGAKQEIDDGGMLWQNGKLYYATGEENEEYELVYEEMMDLAPGTYIFKRVMNFHFSTANYSTFIVMDANGKELKKVENIASPAFSYISTVGFGVADADKAVICDDFKIYLTGTAQDFSLYDAKTGQDAKLGETRNKSTAYRLSWLNATAKEETVTIKADITSGGNTVTKIVKEIKMAPGTDGIDTGIVEIKEGESVKVYLDTTVAAPVEPGKTEPTVAPTEPQATEPQATEPQATEGTKAPTSATKATSSTKMTSPTGIKITKATEPQETEAPTKATKAPTKATKKPTKATEEPTEATEETAAPTEETIAPTEQTQAPTEETQAPTEATELPDESKETMGQTQTPTDDDGGSKVWLIVVIAVVVLAGAGAAVYFFVIKKKK